MAPKNKSDKLWYFLWMKPDDYELEIFYTEEQALARAIAAIRHDIESVTGGEPGVAKLKLDLAIFGSVKSFVHDAIYAYTNIMNVQLGLEEEDNKHFMEVGDTNGPDRSAPSIDG